MGEQVVTRIVHREIVVGDGALKSKVEKPLTEEDRILEELNEPVKQKEDYAVQQTEISQPEPVQQIEQDTPVAEEHLTKTAKPLEAQPVELIHQEETPIYFGNWKFVEHVADGRRCSVDRVRNDSGLEAALKSLRDVSHAGTSSLKKEAKIIMELAGEGSKYTPQFAISDIYSDKTSGIYTEFVPFSDKDLLEGKELKPFDKIALFLKMLEPVERLHAKGHVLLDIKLSNYRFRENGEPVLVDFESRRASGLREISQSIIQSMSVQDNADMAPAVTTLTYMAPELRSGDVESVKGKEKLCDVYSSGVMLYHLLMERAPWISAGALTKNFEIVEALGKEKAEELDKLIREKVLSENTWERPQSVKDFSDMLKQIIGYEEKLAAEESVNEGGRVEKAGELENKVNDMKDSVRTGEILGEESVTALEVIREFGRTLDDCTKKIGEAGHTVRSLAAEKLLKLPVEAAKQLGGVLSFTFALPSAMSYSIRVRENTIEDKHYRWRWITEERYLAGQLVGLCCAFFGSFVGAIATGAVLNYPEETSRFYLAPITILGTNLASGIVEGVRWGVKHLKENAKKRKEESIIESARKYGLSVEEVKKRMAKEEETLRMLKKDDLSMFISDGRYRDYQERRDEGMRIFKEKFGSEPRSEGDTYIFFIEQGLAYDEQSARMAIKQFNKHYFPNLKEVRTPQGERGFKLR